MYGPPGCGKTMLAKAVAHHTTGSLNTVHSFPLLSPKFFPEHRNERVVNCIETGLLSFYFKNVYTFITSILQRPLSVWWAQSLCRSIWERVRAWYEMSFDWPKRMPQLSSSLMRLMRLLPSVLMHRLEVWLPFRFLILSIFLCMNVHSSAQALAHPYRTIDLINNYCQILLFKSYCSFFLQLIEKCRESFLSSLIKWTGLTRM